MGKREVKAKPTLLVVIAVLLVLFLVSLSGCFEATHIHAWLVEIESQLEEECQRVEAIMSVTRYTVTDKTAIVEMAELGIVRTGHNWSVPDTVYVYDVDFLSIGGTPSQEDVSDWTTTNSMSIVPSHTVLSWVLLAEETVLYTHPG